MVICAKKRDCPIFTCDSDFFIYDIPEGVIVVDKKIDMTKFKMCEETGNYLEVEMYHINAMMLQIGPKVTDHKMIALLVATVLGNDRMSMFQCQNVLQCELTRKVQ